MKQGMITMDASLTNLLNAKLITPEEAYMKAANKDLFEKYLEEESDEGPQFPEGYQV